MRCDTGQQVTTLWEIMLMKSQTNQNKHTEALKVHEKYIWKAPKRLYNETR